MDYRKAQNMQVAKMATPVQKSNLESISRSSSVVSKNVNQGSLPKPASFRVTLTPGGADKKFIIGDPLGLIAAINSGITYTEPTSGTIAPAALKAVLQNKTVISGFSIESSVSASQLATNPVLVSGEMDGNAQTRIIDLSTAKRNDAQNDKLLTIDLSENPIVLDKFRAFTLDVVSGETVNITFFIAAVER